MFREPNIIGKIVLKGKLQRRSKSNLKLRWVDNVQKDLQMSAIKKWKESVWWAKNKTFWRSRMGKFWTKERTTLEMFKESNNLLENTYKRISWTKYMWCKENARSPKKESRRKMKE